MRVALVVLLFIASATCFTANCQSFQMSDCTQPIAGTNFTTSQLGGCFGTPKTLNILIREDRNRDDKQSLCWFLPNEGPDCSFERFCYAFESGECTGNQDLDIAFRCNVDGVIGGQSSMFFLPLLSVLAIFLM
eukprot:TRINITY_DN321_c0_g1_i2.p2 TRINITY_DN321_c0_g1~~TRINITY_DN321_c0_g1_i2.p2  ORF type:complete len:133 (-),score=26.98 TRINITY_DN321_c0_g1_i2:55-453(-)